MKILVLTLLLLQTPTTPQPPVQAQITDVAIAFTVLQYASLTYNLTSVCTVPGLIESCSLLVPGEIHGRVITQISAFRAELAKFPSAYKVTALEYVNRIEAELDSGSRLRLTPYLNVIRVMVK